MGHLSYEDSKKIVLKTILVLGAITIGEVLFALLGKGYIIEGVHFPGIIIALVMITMSLVKAYLVVFEFMHMKYELKPLVRSVLLPLGLLIWGIIAFLWEGDKWGERRTMDDARSEYVIEHDFDYKDINKAEDSGH